MINNLRLLTFALSTIFITICSNAQINFSTQSSYKYLKGNTASNLTLNWINSDFDDSSWLSGIAPFRYGDGIGGTELTDMVNNYSTLYLRSEFSVGNLALLNEVSIATNWDDGFVLWINGQEILSQQAPTSRVYNGLATGLHESGVPQIFKFNVSDLNLTEGNNTIAVYACNITLSNSSDFYYDMSISSFPEMPELIDSVGLVFSHSSDFYDSNFDLTISTSIPGAKIIYTLDGSNPQKSTTSITDSATTIINIDPNSSINRGTTPGVVVRASAITSGLMASKPETRSFIFLENVKTQSHPGGNWPTWNVNNQILDFEMDPDVTNSSQYSGQIKDALLDIPTLSVTTDNANLFDPSIGIYVNAEGQGKDWERECSVELINNNGNDGFNVNAGLRIRGGWSRHDEYPKHSFRLFFRKEYGSGKLKFPLFEDEGVDKFDKIDLRCAQNYSWSNWGGEYCTFVREVFTRDSQKEVGKPYTRSRYYHLYLNGMYWGLYQTQERAEARFASDYLGGKNEDYDVIKIGGEDYSKILVATDGTLDKWREIYNLTQKGFTNNADYFFLEGKNADGRPIKNAEILVDIDNLIDYMINIFYSGNYDSPVSAWGGNKRPNNMYAIGNREDKTAGFKFFIHDGEHTLMTKASSGPGIGMYENRVNIGDRTGDDKMYVSNFGYFHIQWLHYKLSANKEYQIRFADRTNQHFTKNGVFTSDKCLERFNARAEQINMAVIAESARWGDGNGSQSVKTKDNAWIPNLNVVRFDYFPRRTNIVITQLKNKNLFSTISAPEIMHKGKEVLERKIYLNSASSISINNPSGLGDIYYTLNGTDPRLIGGEISSDAIKIDAKASISIPESAVISVRVLNNKDWSAIKKVNFIAEQSSFNNFKITELHYHPTDSITETDTVLGKSYEFVEFKNTGNISAINLSGIVIDSAIYYEFPKDYLLPPQQFFVVAAKPKKFYDRHGMIASGNSKNSFSNSGEQILVTDKNGISILDFSYSDKLPWSEAPDGDGPSLVSVEENPIGNPGDYEYWRKSILNHGSPFHNDNMEELLSNLSTDASISLKVFPNPTNNELQIISENSNEILEIKLFDITGTLVHSTQTYGKAYISLSDLNINHGVYILRIESENFSKTKKIIYTPL